MEYKKDVKKLFNFAKKIVDKKTLKKIKKVKDIKEKVEMLKYSIKTELEMMHYSLIRKIRRLEKEKKDVFCEEVKTSLLNSKIKYFLISYHKDDFKNILSLYKEIERGLLNVQSV
ncbi:MAG: hypothetical protein QXW97_00070 [Candidatus Pacearchaeota archaeon]